MNQLNCVIVDDEYLATRVMEEYAGRMDELNVMKTFTDAMQAVNFIKDNDPDLLLLDIQMPFLNGFELLKQLPAPPLVIFTTARHDFAVQAFELDVVDYLVKPVSFERFTKAIERAAEYLQYKRTKNADPGQQPDYLVIKADYRIIKLQWEEILFIEGHNEYVKVHTAGKTYTTLAALKDLEKQMPVSRFIRIHKSYIVSTGSIKEFTNQSVKLLSGRVFSIGRSYKKDFIKRMKP